MSARNSQYTYSYTYGPPIPTRRPVSTSTTEIRHLLLAALVLTLDFVLIYGGPSIYPAAIEIRIVATAAAATVTAFVAHELAHKISAQRRGYWAEFRFSLVGLLTSLLIASVGVLFAAPGATMIGGMTNRDDWGRTSLAGPSTNFVFALLFLGSSYGVATAFPTQGILSGTLLFLAYINGWFGAFNMIPLGPLDGAKVWRWNRAVWVTATGVFAALAGFLFYLVGF